MRRSHNILIAVLVLLSSCREGSDEPCTLKFYGDAYEDTGYSIEVLDDGYVIAGQTTDLVRRDNNYIESSNKNLCIIKTGWNGNVIWKITAGGKFDDWGSKIIKLADGSLICTGTFTDDAAATPGNTDIFAVKVSSSGDILWQHNYGDENNQTGKDIIEVPDGFLILGSTDAGRVPVSDSTGNRAGNTDILIVKITEDGDLTESFAYGYPGNDLGSVLKHDQGDNFILLGTTDRSEPGQDMNNLIIVRLNSAYNAIESRIIGGIEEEKAADLEVLSDGYLVSATTGKDDEEQKIYLTRLTSDIFAPPVAGFPKHIAVNSLSSAAKATFPLLNGSFIIAGQSGSGNSADMLLFEIDMAGNMVAGHSLIKGSTGNQVAYDVVSEDDGFIVAVGSNSYDANSMISFLKFRF
jgi:hypothetical protein